MTFKLKYIPLLMFCFILKQDLEAQIVPPPATQAEVDAGANRFKYVTPYTLANSTIAGGPTNGVTASAATNIANTAATNAASTKQHGSTVLTNLSGTGAATNVSTKDFYLSGGTLYSQNLSANSRWVYFDDFNTPSVVPGLLPDAPTGHQYTLLTQYGNTNQIEQTNGYWSMGATGAVYRSVHFRTNAQYGTTKYPNSFGGNFRYRKSTNGTIDGIERALTFILSTNADFVAKPPFLHVSVGASGFHVGRELSATNLLYIHPLDGSRNLQHMTNYNFNLSIIGNVLIAEHAGHRYMAYDESLSTTYAGLNVATWESTGSHTNEAWGEWDSAWAGYVEQSDEWLFNGPFTWGSNGILNSITLDTDDAYASGWNGSLDVPTKNAIYDKIETLGGGGGGSSSNFFDINITNTMQRSVWRAGSTTNLTIPWGVTNRVIWHPASNAGLQMSGTPGGGTNEQVIHVTICLTNSAITSVVMPTNELSGLAPFFLTAPSTNEFDFVYNGDKFYIVSYQTPTTGSGQIVVVNTNPVVYTPTIRQVPTVVTGTGGANTNFTLLATQPEVSINGFTNVSIRAVMGYDAALVDYWTVVITNGSGSSRTLEFSAVTNNWRFNGVYGTNAPNTLTNATRLEISGRQHGTNVQALYSYTPWP